MSIEPICFRCGHYDFVCDCDEKPLISKRKQNKLKKKIKRGDKNE